MKKISKLFVAGLMGLAGMQASASTFIGDRTDFRDETIYFAMTTRFYDGDITNNTYCWDGRLNVNDPEWRGDFKGLIEKLDYIKALGFTAVWITPVVENASGLDYHGYHAINFQKVDPRYESADCKFQDLIDAAHSRGMKIILDIVLQHTGNFGEEHLCPMFAKDYSQNLGDINASMKLHPNSKLPSNYFQLQAKQQYDARLGLMKNTQGKNQDTHNYWHHYAHFGWDDPSRWWGQIAGDCVDLNTENAAVTNYLVDCYTTFINMGVDGFRIDTGGHISRLSFNKMFIPQLHAAAEAPAAKAKRGGTPFFMYTEVCARARQVIYRGENYNCSPCFYTWKEDKDYAWDMSETSWDNYVVMEGETGDHVNAKSVLQQAQDYLGHADNILKKSNNAWLNGNSYRTEDYSQYSGLNVIDFAMHWNFAHAQDAFNIHGDDNLYNDARYNVVYVDSHDYGPDGNPDGCRFSGSEAALAENFSLMFTFRGIPCIYYGTEVQFRKGAVIDKGPDMALKEGGRAYFGGYITGSVNVSDFATYSGASGNMAATLTHPIALHLQRLNKIRAAVPALRKGQYSTDGCSGNMAYKRRYVDANTDSYVLVTVSGNASFTGILNGTYTDVVTGDVKTVTDGKLTVNCSGQGNLRAYVLSTDKTPAPGKIGQDGKYLYASSSVSVPQGGYDGNEEAEETTTVKPSGSGGGGTIEEPVTPVEPAMNSGEQAVFFDNTDSDWGGYINCYAWNGGSKYFGEWSGTQMTYLGNKIWKITYTGSEVIPETAGVIFNNGSSQTGDFTWKNGGYYNVSGYVKTIPGAGEIVPPTPPVGQDVTYNVYFTDNGGTPWANVYTWIWTSSKNYTGGTWPGVMMTSSIADGATMWSYSFTTSDDMSGAQIIFNNGNGGAGNQTSDFPFENEGIYNREGKYSSGISGITFDSGMKVYAVGGVLYIRSSRAMNVAIYDASGRMVTRNVNEGLNVINDLPRGFYIVNNTKVVL